MTGEQIKLLTRMKKLINQGHRRFEVRKDRDYLQDLLDIGITESEAWNEILLLSVYDYRQDYRPFYNREGSAALIFKKIINGYMVYIKLKLEKDEIVVCLSFHLDYR